MKGIVKAENFSYVPPVARKIQAKENNEFCVQESDCPSEKQMQEWESEMNPNMKGLFAVCYRKAEYEKELSREVVYLLDKNQ